MSIQSVKRGVPFQALVLSGVVAVGPLALGAAVLL